MDDTTTGSLLAFRVIFGKEYRSQTLLHVPFHEVSQHAQKDVADDSPGLVVVDGPYFEVHGLEAPEGLLYNAEPLVIVHQLFRSRLLEATADGIHAVQGCFAGYGVRVAFVAEKAFLNLQIKMLFHLPLTDDLPHTQADRLHAAQGIAFAPGGHYDLLQRLFGLCQQSFAVIGRLPGP